MSTEITRYLAVSGRIETNDLDWELAREAGLTDDERFALTYFADIESQTIRYLRTLLQMKIALEPDIAAFLTTWSYEEFFHGQALAKLLEVTGNTFDNDRVMKVSRRARFNERLEALAGPILSTLFRNHFAGVYMSFGAIQEITTLRGYESLQAATRNPVLRTLCERIAKQERRHFAWYFNHAREELARSPRSRFLARTLLQFNWVPVGAGVKTEAEVRRLFTILFPAEHGNRLVQDVDSKIGSLPGLDGIRLMRKYFQKGKSPSSGMHVDRCLDIHSWPGSPIVATCSSSGIGR
jgi:Fatty acid desaturase